MADKEPRKKKVKCALIWWMDSKQKSVIPASRIPKEKQFSDAITDIWWSEGGKRRKFKAKVIQLSYDAAELDNLPLSSEGTLVSGEIFSQHIIDARQKLIENSRSVQKHVKNVQAAENSPLIEDPGIFGDFIWNLLQIRRTRTDETQSSSTETNSHSQQHHSTAGDLSCSSSSLDQQKQFANSIENQENEAPIDGTSAVNIINHENHGIRERQAMDCDDEDFENEASAIAQAMKHKVSASEVKSAKLYAAALEIVHTNQQNIQNIEYTQISDSFHHPNQETPTEIRAKIDAQNEMNHYSPGDDKVEVWPGCRFYVHTMDYGFVKKSAKFNGVISWGALVTNMLIEIYGRNICYYSATGHRLSQSLGIDKRLYRGLWGWVENITKNNPIGMSDFNAHINRLISSKRRYMSEFIKKAQIKSKSETDFRQEKKFGRLSSDSDRNLSRYRSTQWTISLL